jgi:catechol 2,3-dioxygenase-like lactoylglutathione lyase family enzyme
MVDFYQEVMGFRVSDRMPYPADAPFSEGVWLRCGTDHHVLALFGLREAPPPSADARNPRPGMHHMAFELTSFEELRAAARYVRGRGLPLRGVRGGGPGCQLRLYFWDPEDNLIELYWALDQIGWDGVARPYPPIEEVDLETLEVDAWLAWKGPEFQAAAAPRSA